MEDDCLIVQNLKENIHLFAVFDGHGGFLFLYQPKRFLNCLIREESFHRRT